VLLVINGAPAVGKTTLAHRYADDHPLALVVDVDLVRTHLGGWREREESKSVARDLAVELSRAHLAAGYDVVVAQYVGRPEFLARLRALAGEAGADFVEVVLSDDPRRVAERFRARRATLAAESVVHPEYDVDDDSVEQVVADAGAALLRDGAARGAVLIDARDGTERAYQELRARTAEATP
jgi:predicted kinase